MNSGDAPSDHEDDLVTPAGRLPLAPRLALHYASLFFVVGIHLPFWPVWLKAQALPPWAIGVVLSTYAWVKVFANPVVTHIADRLGHRRTVIVRLSAGALIAAGLFAVVDGFLGLFLLSIAWAALFTPTLPLTENLGMVAVRRRGLDYGRLRLWGSLAFIAASTGLGAFLEGRAAGYILAALVAAHALGVVTSLLLPDVRGGRRAETPAHPGRLATRPLMLAFLTATGLTHVSHVIYYGFSTLHWQAAGIPDGVIGLLWAEGVIAEVLLFAVSGAVVDRVGPARLLVLAGLGGVVRWTVLGLTTNVWLLALAQPLHAATFACTHLGAMHFIGRAAPAGQSATAQGLYSAVGMGGALGIAMLGAGALYEALKGDAFLLMTGVAALGAAVAAVLAGRWTGGRLE